jgi:serine/threonine protein kinase
VQSRRFRVALAAGTRLGPYEIAAHIDAGGMGEAYRATDTNLKRAVAIKVLPQAVAADLERAARFQHEAEVLAALNHRSKSATRSPSCTPETTIPRRYGRITGGVDCRS